MHLTRPRMAAVAAATVLTALLAGCASGTTGSTSNSSSAPVAFKLATSGWIGFGPWFIAQKKGYFAAHGVTVELTNFDDSAAETSAVSTGKVDGANYATNVWLQQLSQGTDLTLVMLEDTSTTGDAILGGPGITSVKDLAGKSVAYPSAGTSELLIDTALAREGVDPTTVKHVELPADQAGAALIAGKVQAAVTYEPYISTALGQDSSITMLYPASNIPGLISDGLVVSPSYLKANPKAVKGMTEAWDDAVTFLKSNPTEGQQIIADGLGSKLSDLQSAIKGVDFYSRSESASGLSGDFVSTTIPLITDAMVAAKTVPSAPNYTSSIDASFVK